MCPTVGKVSNSFQRGRQKFSSIHPLKTITIYLCPESKRFATLFQQPVGLLLVGVLYKLFKDAPYILAPCCLVLHSNLESLAQKPLGTNLMFLSIHLLKNIVQISIF